MAKQEGVLLLKDDHMTAEENCSAPVGAPQLSGEDDHMTAERNCSAPVGAPQLSEELLLKADHMTAEGNCSAPVIVPQLSDKLLLKDDHMTAEDNCSAPVGAPQLSEEDDCMTAEENCSAPRTLCFDGKMDVWQILKRGILMKSLLNPEGPIKKRPWSKQEVCAVEEHLMTGKFQERQIEKHA